MEIVESLPIQFKKQKLSDFVSNDLLIEPFEICPLLSQEKALQTAKLVFERTQRFYDHVILNPEDTDVMASSKIILKNMLNANLLNSILNNDAILNRWNEMLSCSSDNECMRFSSFQIFRLNLSQQHPFVSFDHKCGFILSLCLDQIATWLSLKKRYGGGNHQKKHETNVLINNRKRCREATQKMDEKYGHVNK
jgi:hypothetical protein